MSKLEQWHNEVREKYNLSQIDCETLLLITRLEAAYFEIDSLNAELKVVEKERNMAIKELPIACSNCQHVKTWRTGVCKECIVDGHIEYTKWQWNNLQSRNTIQNKTPSLSEVCCISDTEAKENRKVLQELYQNQPK